MRFVQSVTSIFARAAVLSGLGLLVSTSVLGACSADAGTSSIRKGGQAGSGTAIAGAGAGSPDAGDFGQPAAVVATPDASQPIGSGSANGCAPGHYVGAFKGMYNSASWGNGSAPLSIEAVASMGRPGLEFWLEKTSKVCTSSEFCADYTVKGGKIRGFANPFANPSATDAGATNPFAIAVRFEIDFGGELDCSTGQFKGLLQNGCYDVATVLYRFEGTAPAQYDRATSSFTQGQWTVKEMPMTGVLFPPGANIGGMGAWDAKLADTGSSPVAAGMGLCK
jgi:hypothetical protein